MASDPSNANRENSKAPAKKEPRNWPLSWVVIAILLYLLFQMAYVVFG